MTARLSGTARVTIACLVVAITAGAGVAAMLLQQRAKDRINSQPLVADFSQSRDWLALGGAWTAKADLAANTSEERGARLINRSIVRGDYQLDSDLRLDTLYGEAGLIFRASEAGEEGVDAYHGYFAGVRPTERVLEFGRADFGWQLLAQKALPESADPTQWIHMRVVAVGCNFGITATFSDGSSTSVATSDASCIQSGESGLRSSLTAARWKSLHIEPVGQEAFRPYQPLLLLHQSDFSGRAALNFTPEAIERYIALTSIQARQHEVLPGVRLVHDFLTSPGRHPGVTLQGEIVSLPPLVELQDDSGTITIPDYQSAKPLKLGDVVEAQGTVVSERFRLHLEDAKIRLLWPDTPFPPLSVSASQLMDGMFRGKAVTLEGTLVSATATHGGYELLLSDQNSAFRALGSNDFRTDFAALEPGSRLRIRGTATSIEKFTNNMFPFTVVTDRVEVLHGPPWWSTRHVLWLLLAASGVFVFVQFLLHRLQQWHLRSVLRERELLAMEMHDTLAQSFAGIAYQLQAASHEKRGESQVQAHIENALKLVHVSHKEARRTISTLRPRYRDTAAILSSLKETAESLSDGGDLTIDASLKGRNQTLPLPITDALFRIGQEAISNAIQHSECKTLTISLNVSRRETSLKISDDGIGIAGDDSHEGLGMEGMKSRAARVGGELEVTSVSGSGTTVFVSIRR